MKKTMCCICGKELSPHRENFLSFPNKVVWDKGMRLSYKGSAFCGLHANFLGAFIDLMKERYRKMDGIEDDDPVYAALNAAHKKRFGKNDAVE